MFISMFVNYEKICFLKACLCLCARIFGIINAKLFPNYKRIRHKPLTAVASGGETGKDEHEKHLLPYCHSMYRHMP